MKKAQIIAKYRGGGPYGYPLLAAAALRQEKIFQQLLDLYEDQLGDQLALQAPRSRDTVLHILIKARKGSGSRYRMLAYIARRAADLGVQLPQLHDGQGNTPLELAVEDQAQIETDMRECEGHEDELQYLQEELKEIERIKVLLLQEF